MDPEILLQMLGASSVEDAVKALTAHNSVITNLKAATGATTLDQVQARVNTATSVLTQLEALTEKKGVEAIGVVSGWKIGAGEHDKTKSELEALKKGNASAAAKAKVAKAIEDGQLPPAKAGEFEALHEKFGPEALDAALAALPAASPKTPGGPANGGESPRQPAIGTVAQTGPATDEERAFMKATGKTLAELRAAAKEWDEADKDGKAVVVTRRSKAA